MITKFVTSLSLNRQPRQHKCLASWHRLGLPIHAIATENQVEQLQSIFAEVDEWSVRPEQPNPWDRPYLVRITDHIQIARESPILLINSDIEIRDTQQEFDEQWHKPDADTLICGVRWEHKPKSVKKELNPYGIDAFRITPAMVKHFDFISDHSADEHEYVIGVPGWDYWLPWTLHLEGFAVRRAESKLMHEIHDMGYPPEAIKIAYRVLEEEFRMPGKALSLSIQWLTGRMGMIRASR
jgi:hypothetical protein